MTAHDYHEGLPGYSPNQILHDGCGECEARSKGPGLGIAELGRYRFVLAWARAAELGRHGLPDVARAELPLLDALWAVQIKLEPRGIGIGEVPSGF